LGVLAFIFSQKVFSRLQCAMLKSVYSTSPSTSRYRSTFVAIRGGSCKGCSARGSHGSLGGQDLRGGGRSDG
jgi:hypothetical protein